MSALTDPIADLLTRLRNASVAGKTDLTLPYSRIKADIAAILQKEGYISEFSVDKTGTHPTISIRGKFVNRVPAITGLKRISRPGLRRYVGVDEIPRVLGGMGISVLSTPRGVLTGREAKRQNVGGELLAYIW